MKRMELEITLTFVLMFVVSFVVNGIHSVITMNSNFFTFEVITNALISACIYLGYIWINTRRHQLLTYIGILSFALAIAFSSKDMISSFSDLDWIGIVMIIYYTVAFIISMYQGKELLEEDEKQ